MIFNDEIANKTADLLLDVKAVKLSPSEPFTWASGIISPIYCDNRITLSFPPIRTFIRQKMVEIIGQELGEIDLIAGVATGGIAQGALVAQDLGLPFAYVRASKKGHGLENLVEGRVEKGQSVVVIEDLISTGKSSLTAVDALREAGCHVKGMVAIFSYDLEIARSNFEKSQCPLYTLSDYHYLVRRAVEDNYIKESDLEALLSWRENPKAWGK
jgi:orotate phosphoribosyltransferase